MALAQVILDEVDAVGSVDARSAQAVVHVDFAVDAVESRVVAVALVRIDSVQAQSVVETWRRLRYLENLRIGKLRIGK